MPQAAYHKAVELNLPPHYRSLGVTRDATQTEIRESYRKLAKKFHPDSNGGDLRAAERFKEISVAYKVLGDASSRRQYDRAFGGLAVAAEPEPSGIRPRSVGRNIKIRLFLTLEEVAQGGMKKLRYARDVVCLVCGGRGILGKGGGSCKACAGKGIVQTDYTARMVYEPGVAEGEVIRVLGAGHADAPSAAPGEVQVELGYKKHRYLHPQGADLHYTALITLDEFIEGGTLKIPTVAGSTTLEVPPKFPDGGQLRIPRKGLPNRRNQRPGDLVVTVRLCLPRKLSGREKSRVNDLLGLPGFSYVKDENGFLTRDQLET